MDKLTELTIRQAKPKLKQYKLFDGGGMFLLVHPNGSKYWQLQYWFDGKQKILSLGVWPNISLKEASPSKISDSVSYRIQIERMTVVKAKEEWNNFKSRQNDMTMGYTKFFFKNHME